MKKVIVETTRWGVSVGRRVVSSFRMTCATLCPFCLQMFEEGIEENESVEGKQARDLIEILDESLGE